MEQHDRTISVLASCQAGLGALVGTAIYGAYSLNTSLLADPSTSLTAAITGFIVAGYYASIHQLLKKRYLATSTLIMTTLSASGVVAVIAQTGGLDSPFYIFWLLIIISAGAFGTLDTVILGLSTIAYFIYEFTLHDWSSNYIGLHASTLIVTVLCGALVELAYWRTKRSGSEAAASLSGQLSQEQLKAQVLMSQMGEGVIVVDSERRIQLFNHAAQTLTGWDEASARGIDYSLVLQLKTLEEQVVPPESDPFIQAWQVGKNVILDNLVMQTKAGRKIQLNISVSPIYDDQHQVSGGIALFRDISAEKAMERQRDEFVSTASHEMRTPVAAIEGYISLAMNANVATIDDRAKGFLIKAHDAVQHLGELFRDLLSVTKAEEGKLHGALVATNITELVQRAVEDMQFTASKKNLTLSFQTAAGAEVAEGKALLPLFWSKVDPERLREVVMNLIDNAVKFTPQGGITISMDGSAKELSVSVKDSGIGIAEEDIGHLFQKFYRIDNSATRTIGGTGLGLYLCRTIIELFSGHITATSKAGEGTTFTFTLPRLSERELAELQAAAPQVIQAMPASQSIVTGNPDTTPITFNPMAPVGAAAVAPISLPVPGQDVPA